MLIKAPGHVEDFTGRMRLGEADSRQARALVQDAGSHLPQGQRASDIFPQRRFDPSPSGHVRDDPDSAYRAAFVQGCFVQGPQHGEIVLVLQRQADRRDFLGWAVGEVGDRTVFDGAPLAG
jgi:hypothetical protein